MLGVMIGILIGAAGILLAKLFFPNAKGDDEILAIVYSSLGLLVAFCIFLFITYPDILTRLLSI